MRKIIMLSGSIGSGKMFVCTSMISKIKETGNSVAMLSHADVMKKLCSHIFGYDKNGVKTKDVSEIPQFNDVVDIVSEICKEYTHIEDVEKRTILVKEDIRIQREYKLAINMSDPKDMMRKLLQIVGTDIAYGIRHHIWLEILISKIHLLEDAFRFDYIFIDDWRHMPEFVRIKGEFNNIEVIPYLVDSDIETRAKRRGIDVSTLMKMENHPSEYEVNEIIKPFMLSEYPNNIIYN